MDQTNRHSANELIKWQKPTLSVLDISNTQFGGVGIFDGEASEDPSPPDLPPRS
jgi:hypothetical protein